MIKKFIWNGVVAIALMGFVSMSTGFYRAMSITGGETGQTGHNIAPTPKAGSNTTVKKTDTIQITLIGDSIARGTGDETGKGFSGNLPEAMRTKTPKDILVENPGIDGLQSKELLELLQSGKLDTALKTPDFVLISIGGNDLRTLLREDETSWEESFEDLREQYMDNLEKIMRLIRKNNRDAYIVFIGLYNPFVTTGSFVDSGLVQSWNYNTQKLVEKDERSIYVSTYDLVKFNTAKYIADDGLHPNSSGYQSISDRIVQAIESVIVNK